VVVDADGVVAGLARVEVIAGALASRTEPVAATDGAA
jgi:hypothetical protein